MARLTIKAENHDGAIINFAKSRGSDAPRWLSLQTELQARARNKFENPEKMVFDREALEQASHYKLAAYHASKYPTGTLVVDLTAGIGADSIAMAKRGQTVAVEMDSERAELASYNLAALDAKVLNKDAHVYIAKEKPQFVWLDPDRRDEEGNRYAKAAQFEPNPFEVKRQLGNVEILGIKLSPLLKDSELRELGSRIEFVSFAGECREVIAWSGAQIEPGWVAVHIESGETIPGEADCPILTEPQSYLYDIDPAAVRAHATGRFDGLSQLGDHPGFATAVRAIETVWLRTYRVLWWGTPNTKKVRAFAREQGLKIFEVKQRGAGLEPNMVLQELKPPKLGRPASLAAYRVGKSIRWMVIEPASGLP
jgi:hypothetical protein